MAGTRPTLALLALTTLAPLAAADLDGRLPDALPEFTLWMNCREQVTCELVELLCTHYTSTSGKEVVGTGDQRQKGIYLRGEYDGERWHYHGYGVSMGMSCNS